MLTVEVEAGAVARAFSDLAARLRSGLAGAWEQIGAAMVSDITPLTPVKSAALVGTLRAAAGPHEVAVTAGGGSVVYAGVQNYGWPGHNIAAQHFMRAGLSTVEDQAPDALGSEIQNIIDRVGLN